MVSEDLAEDDDLRLGTIRNISGAPGSGLWQVYFEDDEFCHIESGHGLRTMARAYRGLENARGKMIRYRTDDLNVMSYFEPVDSEED